MGIDCLCLVSSGTFGAVAIPRTFTSCFTPSSADKDDKGELSGKKLTLKKEAPY